jgi:hypothetical protein
VADPKQNPLTEAQDLSIHSTALQPKRNAAAAARKAVATAQIDVDAKQTDLDVARLEALAKDIDADPETDAAVAAAKAALETAQDDLASVNTAFTSDMQTDLVDWESAVPDVAALRCAGSLGSVGGEPTPRKAVRDSVYKRGDGRIKVFADG